MSESLSSKEINHLFIEGDRNLYRGNFTQAINIFERLLKIIEPSDNNYFNIQRNLVKAYQKNEQKEQAIALCQLMIDSNSSLATLWGTKFMANLVTSSELELVHQESDQKLITNKINNINTPIKSKTLSEFKQYCQENLLDSLKKVERKRINTLFTIIISGIVCLVATWSFCQFILSFLRISGSIDIFFPCALGLTIPIWIIFCRGCIKVYGLGFKRNIIENIINFIDDSETLNYASNLFLEDKRQTILGFTQSQLFRDELYEPDNLEQEDCVYGSVGNTDIFFAEITVENIRSGSLNEFEIPEFFGKSVLFRGLFFEAKFPKAFKSRTFILPKTLTNKIDLLNKWRGEKVVLEDLDFSKRFQVYSDNQVEARYILSTNLINRLVEFNHKARRKVYISFVAGFIYIAIPYRHNLFEAKILKNMTSFSPLKEYFLDLQLMIGIVNDLSLNRRIWGDE